MALLSQEPGGKAIVSARRYLSCEEISNDDQLDDGGGGKTFM